MQNKKNYVLSAGHRKISLVILIPFFSAKTDQKESQICGNEQRQMDTWAIRAWQSFDYMSEQLVWFL